MWISILNRASSRIEVADIEEYEEETGIHNQKELAEQWLIDNDFLLDEVNYILTDDEPEIYDHNTQNVIDMPL